MIDPEGLLNTAAGVAQLEEIMRTETQRMAMGSRNEADLVLSVARNRQCILGALSALKWLLKEMAEEQNANQLT